MNRDKQIEEIARDICECFNNDGTCYQDDKLCDCKCEHFTDAQHLYNKGYRKASEVAREIFAELDKHVNTLIIPFVYAVGEVREKKLDGLHMSGWDYVNLKKKYESEGEE